MTFSPHVSIIPTDQFKTLTVSLKFIGPFRPETANERVLLPQVLLAQTKRHPSKQAMQLQFDLLYGTQILASTAKVGLQSVITFSASVLREDLLARPIYAAVADLFHEVLTEPRLRKGTFLQTVVNQEIRLLEDSLHAIYNDKTELAYRQMRAKMFEGELFAASDQGDLDTLSNVSAESLMGSYREMMETDAVELYIVGDASAERFAAALSSRITFRTVPETAVWLDRELSKRNLPQTIVDHDGVKQTKIDIGYRTHTWYDSKDVFAMFVFNTLFGDSEQSVLFQTVRERDHLCYSIQSSYHHNKGFLVVSAGVEAKEATRVGDAVEAIRQKIADGEFDDDDLSLAKKWLLEGQKRGLDSPSSMIVRHFNYKHQLKRPYEKDLFEMHLANVTKQDVQLAAAKLTLDTIHVLTEGDSR